MFQAEAFPVESQTSLESRAEMRDPAQFQFPELDQNQTEIDQSANFTHHGDLQAPVEANRAAQLATPANVVELHPIQTVEAPQPEPEQLYYADEAQMKAEVVHAGGAVMANRNFVLAA
jgi:hypothetical protein